MDTPIPLERADTDADELFDRYLDLALAGEAPEAAAFLAAHGAVGTPLRERLEALHEELGRRASGRTAGAAPARREAADGLPFERLGRFRLLGG